MNWSNAKLIFEREIRDQLRDRRTLFMIAVVPLLLYPLLGICYLQVSQFLGNKATRVLIVGLPPADDLPPLVAGDHFAPSLFSNPERARLLKIETRPALPEDSAPAGLPPDAPDPAAQRALAEGRFEAVVVFPSDFAQRLEALRRQLQPGTESPTAPVSAVPSPAIYHNSSKESSHLAYLRVNEVLTRWTEQIGEQNLSVSHVPPSTAKPFSLAARDLSKPAGRKAAMWSKILPFVLLLWSLTGAFYPAVDLCAGEKERGTLETLLSSPAERSEIVWGKLLTVMVFSMTTALLNLLSMCVIGSLVLRQLDLGPPPALSILWLLIALIPTSALFSGLCLSLAAFARSTKEGQYYLMPLVLITMPLAILPMAPGVELNLGNSVIPVTGLVLLLRTLLEDDYAHALPYVPIVVGVTLTCCLLAVRWAADQFNSESVLFRESERLDMGLWLRRLVSDREPTPSVGEAIFCGVTILTIKFLMGLALPPTNPAWSSDQKFQHFFELVMVVQLAVIATPALLMAIMLTSDKRQTLLLRMPAVSPVFAALALAVAVHPLVRMLGEVVQRMYPLSDEIRAELNNVLDSETAPIGLLLLAVAVVPAICEELAFRGFILSGLRHMGHKWRAIAISSIFFGITHAVFQQSLVACLLGAVIGFLAVQTGSLLPGVVFHMTNNGLSVLVAKYLPDWLERSPHSTWLATIHQEEGATELVFAPWLILISAALVTALLFWFHRLPYARSEEEALQETIEHQAAQPVT